uniref:ABC transporter substrate-binding protein n=1 Tax=Pedobacter sp. TaxID=1411316 RepID=UPI003D7FB47E
MKKKILALCLIISMSFVLISCGGSKLSGNLRIGTLAGPTGMGLIDLNDNSKIDLELYQAPTDAVQKLISGDLDAACLPSNLGATLYAKTNGNIQILTTVVNGVLYIVENGDSVQSLQDLKGKTIIGSGKGGTPEYVLETLLKSAGLKLGTDVKVKWLDNHADVAQKVASKKGAIGLLPEP